MRGAAAYELHLASRGRRREVTDTAWRTGASCGTSMCSICCPCSGLSVGASLSLPRVLWSEFPCFDGTIKTLRLPAAHPATLRCLRLAVPQRPLVLFAPRRTSAPPKPGVGDPVSPAGTSLRKRQDLPSSWETDSCFPGRGIALSASDIPTSKMDQANDSESFRKREIGGQQAMSNETPHSLLERLRSPSNREAWQKFVALYTPLLLHWARRVGLDASDAADLTQDVLLLLVRKRTGHERREQHLRFAGGVDLPANEQGKGSREVDSVERREQRLRFRRSVLVFDGRRRKDDDADRMVPFLGREGSRFAGGSHRDNIVPGKLAIAQQERRRVGGGSPTDLRTGRMENRFRRDRGAWHGGSGCRASFERFAKK